MRQLPYCSQTRGRCVMVRVSPAPHRRWWRAKDHPPFSAPPQPQPHQKARDARDATAFWGHVQTPRLILQEWGSVKWPNRSLQVSRSSPGLHRSHTQVTAPCGRPSLAQTFPSSADSDALVFEIDVETWDHRKMGKNRTMIFLFDKIHLCQSMEQ